MAGRFSLIPLYDRGRYMLLTRSIFSQSHFIAILLVVLTPMIAITSRAEDDNQQLPSITISSDKNVYSLNEDFRIKIALENPGQEITVDQYIVYQKGNKLYFYPDWNTTPAYSRATLPARSEEEHVILEDKIDNHFQDEGDYTFAAGLSYPGTLEFIGEISTVTITVTNDRECPENMVKIDDDLCIDIFEASKEDATYTFGGESIAGGAYSKKDVIPWNMATWFQAQQACIKVGKRLCTIQEWQDACDGTIGEGGYKFPYGDTFDVEKCNVKQSSETIVIMPTGSFPECISPFGAYDMTGNLFEWTSDWFDTSTKFKQLMGGSWENGDFIASCNSKWSVDYPDNSLTRIGFRCCYPLKNKENNPPFLEIMTQRNYLYSNTESYAYLYWENPTSEPLSGELIVAIVTQDNKLYFYPDWNTTPSWEHYTLDAEGRDLIQLPLKLDLTPGSYRIAAGIFELPEFDGLTEISIYEFEIFQKREGICPDDMVPVGDLYCIDKYEVSREDATADDPGENNQSNPLSRKGYMPWSNISQYEASAACTRVGKRLCTRGEWGDACDGTIGPGGWILPYGDYIDWSRKKCNRRNKENWHYSPAGSFEECVSQFGAYDMNGNFWEFDADEIPDWSGKNTLVGIRGGDFSHNSANFDKCFNIYAGHTGPSAHDDVSFRCCM